MDVVAVGRAELNVIVLRNGCILSRVNDKRFTTEVALMMKLTADADPDGVPLLTGWSLKTSS